MTRRDILKGLFSIPVFGLLFQQYVTKRKNYDSKRDALLKELNIDQKVPAVVSGRTVTEPGDRLRIGIIGFGNRGESLSRSLGYIHPRRIDYLRKQARLDKRDTRLQDWLQQDDLNISINRICDVFDLRTGRSTEIIQQDIVNAKNTNKKSAIKTCRDYREMLADPEVDAVVIATPDFHHAQMSIDALNAGKHVYCEKCMTRTEEEAHALVEAVEKSGKIFQVGHQTTQGASYRKAQEIVAKNLLGPITLIEATTNRNTPDGAWIRHLDNKGNPRAGSPQTIDWNLWLGNSPKVPFDIDRYYNWTKWWDYGTGLAGQLLSHEYDTANQLLNLGIPKSVVASGGIYFFKDNREIPDVFHVVCEFPDQDLSFIYSASLASSRPRGRVFMGHDGSMELGNSLKINIDTNSTRFKDRITDGLIDTSMPVLAYQPGSDQIDAITSATEKYYARRGLTYTYRDGKRVDSAHLHLKEWLDCIRFGGLPTSGIQKGFEVTIACHMATRSYLEKRRVEWDPLNKRIV